MAAAAPPEIVRFGREEFLADRWHYRAGEHVTFIAPTGAGKTTLMYQLLEVTAHEDLPAVVLVMKPRDTTARDFTKRNGYRRVTTWPPAPSIWQPGKRAGYTLWPRHQMYDPRSTREHQARVFGYAMLDCYAKGSKIIAADELYSLDNELDLGEELVCVWTKGRSMDCGLWGATQKPSHVPLWAYSQATHLFLSYDPDKRARDRFREIGGMDPKLVEAGVDRLDEFEWVYVHRKGRSSTICLIAAD